MGERKVVNLQSREQLINDKKLGKLFCLMPQKIQDSFTDEQLKSLKVAITATSWKKHAIDIRSSLSLFSYRYYYVFIGGREQRQMTRHELRLQRFIYFLFFSLFLIFCISLGLLMLYLIKSAMGINIFPHFSLGIWDWFKMTFL